MAYFYDDCLDLDNWHAIKGSITADTEGIKVNSWTTSGSNRVAQFYVHMFDEPMNAQDDFEFHMPFQIGTLNGTVITVQFGDISTGKWAFGFSAGFNLGNVAKAFTLDLKYNMLTEGDVIGYVIDGTIKSNPFNASNLYIQYFRITDIHDRYLVKDARITITRPSAGNSTAIVENVECIMNKENVTSVQLSSNEIESYLYGNVEHLNATICPSNADNQNVIWKSSNPDVASVSQKGVVTPLSLGTTTITATTEDGGYADSCEVSVKKYPIVMLLRDYWTGVILNYENTMYDPDSGGVDYGGFSLLDANGDSLGGGDFTMKFNGYASISGAPLEEFGPSPYSYDGDGYLIEEAQGSIHLGENDVYLKTYSIKAFEFFDTITEAPIGIGLFGGPIQVRMLIDGSQANDIHGDPLIYTGVGSYFTFEYIKPGTYDLEVSGPYLAEPRIEKNITVGIMEAYEPVTSFYYTPPPLPQVAQPSWVSKVATWKDVANAEQYEIKLYNASSECLDTQRVNKGTQRYDYTDLIENYLPAGSYTFTVQALPRELI